MILVCRFSLFVSFLVINLSLYAQTLPDISGTWYSNGVVTAPARISQNGNKLAFSYNQSNSTGYFTGPNQIFAIDWNTSAVIEPDGKTITWNNQVWKREPVQLNYPDISGTWYMNGDANIPCQIAQNGTSLSFSFSNGHSDGYYYESNKIYAKDWNAYAELSADHTSIKWNDQTWTRNPNTNSQDKSQSRYCRVELSSFYYAAQCLGAVWGRSATEPVMPTAIAIAAMETHIDLALATYKIYQNCLQYDFVKLKNLRTQLHGMPSAQITQSIDIIIKELQGAISQAPFACDHGVSPLAIYVGGIHLGAAQAWASAQQCRPTPMPANIASAIMDHLTTASSALLPYSKCLEAKQSDGSLVLAFDFSAFSKVPLTSTNSIEAHTHIVGIETQLLWAIGMSDCCCNCRRDSQNQGTSDCDATCKEFCKKQGYQNGRFNGKTICLLGQVSGGMNEGCDCGN